MTARNLPIVDESVGEAGDVDNLVALLEMTDGVAAVVDLTRNARYGDDVRTEILGSEGAIFVDLLPIGRTRLATRAGVEVVSGSEVADATAAGLAAQALALEAAISGEREDVPGAAASSRAVQVGRAVQLSADDPIRLRLNLMALKRDRATVLAYVGLGLLGFVLNVSARCPQLAEERA